MMTPTQEKHQKAIMTVAHHTYARELNVYASFKISSGAKGEDLVQDTFIKTWRYLVKGGNIETMRSFLYHVLNQLIIDEYRRGKTVSLDALLEKGFEPNSGHFGRIFNIVDGKSAGLLIDKLPIKYQKVMRMRYVQDLSLQEIARITGRSKNAITVQAHRGLKKLQVLYNSPQATQ